MILDYLFYFLLADGLSLLMSAAFGRFRGDHQSSFEEDKKFERRITAIEREVGGEKVSGQKKDKI